MIPNYPESTRRAFARNVLENTLRMNRGENLMIETWSATLPWAESFELEARILGARPLLLVEDEATFWSAVENAPAAQVARVGSHEWAALKASDAHMFFWGPYDTVREQSLPDSVVAQIDAADHEWFRLVAKHGIRCARWDLGRTNEATAREYGVDVDAWRRELVDAALVDPHTLRRDGRRIAQGLRRGKEVRITHPNGTDLTLHLAGRSPRIDDGVIDADDLRTGNVVAVVPSGVTAVTVDEHYAEGSYVGDSTGVMFYRMEPTALPAGTWTFRRGRLVQYGFRTKAEAFERAYPRLGPGKDRPGLLSVGLNPKLSLSPLLFDQGRGTIALTIGRDAHQGGKTRTPHFTAYQLHHGATMTIDGETLVEAGDIR